MKFYKPLVFFLFAAAMSCPVFAQDSLDVARYSSAGELRFPDSSAFWVHMGTTLGGDYGENAFDPANPGILGVVQMEPEAYRYFTEHGTYANGTMFLLSFYTSEVKSEPQLQGFVQGALLSREIHVIDAARYAEGSAFFMYAGNSTGDGRKMPEGSECMQCHKAEGDYRATFIQFYPAIRELSRH